MRKSVCPFLAAILCLAALRPCAAATTEPDDPEEARIQFDKALQLRQSLKNDMVEAQNDFMQKKAEQEQALMAMRNIDPVPVVPEDQRSSTSLFDPQRAAALIYVGGIVALVLIAIAFLLIVTRRANAARIPAPIPLELFPPAPPLSKLSRPKAIEVRPEDRDEFLQKIDSAIENFKKSTE